MRVWINKVDNEEVYEEYSEALVFNFANKNNKSNIKTHIEDLWRRFGLTTINDINEDLVIIAMSIFAIDKRIPRTYFSDNWTRSITVNIPVLECEKWREVKSQLEDTLGFLSGDVWEIEFRSSNGKFRANRKNTQYKLIKDKKFDCVSLFSGGLDSFCGAIKLLSDNKATCFVGFQEYGLLGGRQQQLYSAINAEFDKVNKELFLFNATPYEPLNIEGEKNNLGIENTSRSRSFLFLAGAIAVASIIGDIPVNIPENGFIGVNVPLTDSRTGSCSTRTTHPYFIKNLNDILSKVGINNKVINPYECLTKGEIVAGVAHNNVFINQAYKTISCSHPCQSRYDHITPPMNCGYCYPCLIRRASMNRIKYKKDIYNHNNKLSKVFIENYNKLGGKSSDLKAVLYSINRYINNNGNDTYINKLLLKSGKLSNNEIQQFNRVYRETMRELIQMIKDEDNANDSQLADYAGICAEDINNA
jgi:7-cyano-7-deazaguanine synthase in queuosine biosynthesis